jgi:hypothetical protein
MSGLLMDKTDPSDFVNAAVLSIAAKIVDVRAFDDPIRPRTRMEIGGVEHDQKVGFGHAIKEKVDQRAAVDQLGPIARMQPDGQMLAQMTDEMVSDAVIACLYPE